MNKELYICRSRSPIQLLQACASLIDGAIAPPAVICYSTAAYTSQSVEKTLQMTPTPPFLLTEKNVIEVFVTAARTFYIKSRAI